MVKIAKSLFTIVKASGKRKKKQKLSEVVDGWQLAQRWLNETNDNKEGAG